MSDSLSEKLYDTEMEIRDLFASLVVEDCDEEELEELISRMRERFRDDKKTFSTPARSSAPWPVEWTPEYASRVKKKEQEDIKTPVRSSERAVEKEMSTDLRRQVLLKVKHRLKSALKSSPEKESFEKKTSQSPEQIKSSIRKIDMELDCMEDTKTTPAKTPKSFERLVTRLTTPRRSNPSSTAKREWLREVERRVKSIITSPSSISLETREWLESAEPRLDRMIKEVSEKRKGQPQSPGLQYFTRILKSIRTLLKEPSTSAFTKKVGSPKNLARRSLFLNEASDDR